jgi:hypothetical protein
MPKNFPKHQKVKKKRFPSPSTPKARKEGY